MRLNAFLRKNCWLVLSFFQVFTVNGQAAVELEKMNVMIMGLENPIRVVIDGLPDSCVQLQPSVGEIHRYGGGNYSWTGITDETFLTVLVRDTCNNQLIDQRKYRLKEPYPMVIMSEPFPATVLEIPAMIEKKQMAIIVMDWQMDATFEVIGYTISFYSKKTGEIWSCYNKGARFGHDVLKYILALDRGDWVQFSEVSYYLAGKKVRTADQVRSYWIY